MSQFLSRLRSSRWTRPLRAPSRGECAWALGLGLAAVVVAMFLISTGGDDDESWTQAFAEGLEKRMPEAWSDWQQADPVNRLGMTFDATLTTGSGGNPTGVRPAKFGPTRFWWIALANLGLLLALFLTRPWWVGPAPQVTTVDGAGDSTVAGRPHRVWWLALALVLLGGLALRAERLDLSLYNDEIMNVKRVIHGNFESWKPGQNPDELRFFERDWETTAWDNHYGSNPIGYSVLARLGLDRWREASGAPLGVVREWPLRLPSLLGSALVIGALALGLRATGLPLAGLLAGAFWAFHPWALRYGSEGRPYGLMMGLVACLLVALTLALRRGGWGAWLAVGISEALALWVTPGALWMVFCLNLVAAALVVWKGWRGGDRGAWQLRRLTVASLLGAGLFLQLGGPALPEFLHAVSLETEGGIRKPIAEDWWTEVGALAATGSVVDDGLDKPAGVPTWADEIGPWPAWSVLLAILVLLPFLPLRAPAWRGHAGIWLALGALGLLSVPLTWLISSRNGTALYSWYVVQLTVPLALLAGLGCEALLRLGVRRGAPALAWVGLAIVVAWAALVWTPVNAALRTIPKENPRGLAAALSAGAREGKEDEILKGLSFNDADFYDPFVEEVHNLGRLRELEAEATGRGVPLRFAIGHIGAGSSATDQIWEHLNESPDWHQIAAFPGLEEKQYASWVFEYRGGVD